jgi:hypothetical protein
MNISTWHYGKIVLIWLFAIVFCFIWVVVERRGFYIIPSIPFLIAFLLTWKWFSGKE